MTINKNDFDGAVLVLTDPDEAAEQAAHTVAVYFPDKPYHFTVTDATPTSLPAALQTRISALQARVGGETFVLTVYPWAASESTLPERPINGQITS